MLVAAAFVPGAPVLIPEVSQGATPEMDHVRAAADKALAGLIASAADTIVVVGSAPRTGPYPIGAPASLAAWGGPVIRPDTTNDDLERLSLPLAMGAWWLDRAGYAGPHLFFGVASDEAADRCGSLGEALADRAGRVAVLVVGDGSACRSPKAPGSLDERAASVDAAVVAALAAVDGDGLLGIDAEVSRELLIDGRAAWQVAAGMAGGTAAFAGDVVATDDSYGVLYLVANWHHVAAEDASS